MVFVRQIVAVDDPAVALVLVAGDRRIVVEIRIREIAEAQEHIGIEEELRNAARGARIERLDVGKEEAAPPVVTAIRATGT